MEEYFFLCPYCGQHISFLLDTSVSAQSYIEDCEVCCRPIEVQYSISGSRVDNFSAHTADE
ncbi:MAG: CPXCG motif-containing cysteine-rich protein [Candidatus Hydrogenedentes bacterium]|nr:CPXCG motif-containing cysteine-rich protein [Candidatus Hydrogenedentota bacterium]